MVEGTIIELLELLKTHEVGLIFTAVVAGTALIFVNVATHWIVDSWRARTRRKDQVERNLKPLLRATGDLISRIVEILITRKQSMLEAIVIHDSRTADEIEVRISNLRAADLDRLESTAYRLINFLALAHAFTRATADLKPFGRLDRIEFFLQHKIAVGLRGNLYRRRFLSTELQEDLAASYLDCDRGLKVTDLSVGCFVAYVKNGRYDHDLYKKALDFFALDSPFFAKEPQINREDTRWQHTLVLAHLAVYLIDFYQELGDDPQWEEHRVFFVRLIRQWNADALKKRYLYEPDDLAGPNYLDTFPAQYTSSQSALPLIVPLPFRARLSRVKKWVSLYFRGLRYGRRHHPKRVSRSGVRILGKDEFHINWTDDLETVFNNVQHCLLRTAQYSDSFEPRAPHQMDVSAAGGVTIFCVAQ